jgi:acetyltransferase-like isoleucine patch superfamily enzyme
MLKIILIKLYRFGPEIIKNRVLSYIVKLEDGYMYSSFIRNVFFEKYNIKIGYGSYGGCFNVNNVPGSVTFGNYCSIAPNFKIFRANHPKNNFTTHPVLYNPIAGYVDEDKLIRPSLIIGNDVWIGEGVIILPTVSTIGNGVIIGAGTIVTKDVAPYDIIVGNPSRVIGKRFTQDVIEGLEESRWWDMSLDLLIKNISTLNKIVK